MLDLNSIEEKLLNEEIDALETFGLLKTHEKQLDKVLDLCKEQAIMESHHYEKNFKLKGYEFEKKNGRSMYNFKGIKEWVDLDIQKKELESKLKNALKCHELGTTPIDDKTGEVLKLPILKHSADVLSVKKINL